MDEPFNYIIPIFNKEDVLPLTLESVDRCASKDARIYAIIDGCTDGSERVVDEFRARTRRDVVKIHLPNVHMLRSVNAALSRVSSGFTIVTQDDILLGDLQLEEKVRALYRRMGDRLGVVSLRLGANVAPTPWKERLRMRSLRPMIRETDFLRCADDPQSYAVGRYEAFYPRMSAINGPNVIPWKVRESVGLLDESLAPYGYDDPEYCLRAMQLGFVNGVFPLHYRSELAWGGTRRSKKFATEARRIHCRNRKYIWSKHNRYLKWLWQAGWVVRDLNPVETLADIPDWSWSAK